LFDRREHLAFTIYSSPFINRNLSPLAILQKYWKHDAFREPQQEIINSVLSGKDTFALMPTGGGKSICFQVPAMVKDGICLVISPLVALMKDQVANLQKKASRPLRSPAESVPMR
jgi:superfamily II DNA helicase RecQ